MQKIPGFEGYFATEEGKIYSEKSKRFLSLQKTGKYQEVGLCTGGVNKKYRVHYLVALAYHPNPENRPQVNHIDGSKDPLDNSPSNLEWSTSKENNRHARRTGLMKPHTRSVCQRDLNGKLLCTFDSIVDAGKQSGLDPRTIVNVCKKRRNTSGGFYWHYKDEEDWKSPVNRACKKVEQIDIKTGELIKVYDSALEASKEIGCSTGSMCNAIKGRIKSLKGYKWRHAPEEGQKIDPIYEESREWATIPGYPRYRISRDGKIYSEHIKRLKSTNVNNLGYHVIGLTDSERKETRFVIHRLVAQAYIPNPENLPRVFHINNERSDSRVENLKWGTISDISQYNMYNSDNKSKKTVIQYDKEGKEITRFPSMKKAADSIGLKYDVISRVCSHKGTNKTAGGFFWRFEDDPLVKVPKVGRKRKVKRIDLDDNEIIFESLTDAALSVGVKNSSHIREVCIGERNKAYNYKWEFVE